MRVQRQATSAGASAGCPRRTLPCRYQSPVKGLSFPLWRGCAVACVRVCVRECLRACVSRKQQRTQNKDKMLTVITTKNYSHSNDNTATTTKNKCQQQQQNDRSSSTTTTTTTTTTVTTRYISTAKQDLSKPLMARSKRCCLT